MTVTQSRRLILFLGLVMSVRPAAPGEINGPLKVSANPNYFQDPSGQVLILNGSQTWNTFQDWGTNETLQTLDFSAFVHFLNAHGHNFTLLWVTEMPKFCGLPTTDSSPPDFVASPLPWMRTGLGNATDGGPKFDLTKFNQPFFDRLRARVQTLRAGGVYAGVYLFTGEWLNIFRCSTDGYPYTGANNINGVDDGYTGGKKGIGSITMTGENAITRFQDAYVEKVIDTLNDLPNVLWIVSEEAPANSTWWNDHQIAHVRAYESKKAHQHPIGYAALIGAPDNIIVNSDADWIAPQVRISPLTTCGSGTPHCKVVVNDSDHSYWEMWHHTPQVNRNYAWENFMNGNQVLFMDPYLVYYPREKRNLCESPKNGICGGVDIRYDNFRDNLGYILQYSRKLHLDGMKPRTAMCSTGYCLVRKTDGGGEFLVYAPSGGAFTVDLSGTSAAKKLAVEWFNPSTGKTIGATPVAAGSFAQTFTPPFEGDAVLYLADSK